VKRSVADAIAAALAPIGGKGRVMWVGAKTIEPRAGDVDLAQGALRGSLDALPEGECDAAVVGPTPGDLLAAVRAVRARVRAGGVVAVVAPLEGAGLRTAAQRALGAFDAKRRPRALEEACGAMLCAGVTPVSVVELRGARGEALLHGVVAPELA
jgi:hypothetical protein